MTVSKAQSPMNNKDLLDLKIQIYLNQNNFGPGYIDGRLGNFSKLAIKAYNLKNNREAGDQTYLAEAEASITDPLVLAIVPSSSSDFINPTLSEDREEQSKLKYMGYRSYIEYMAERYNTSVGFLKRINSYKAIKDLKPRSAIIVPNVAPFFIENLIPHKSFQAEENHQDRALIIDTETNQLYIYSTTRLFAIPEPEQIEEAAVIEPKLDQEEEQGIEEIKETKTELNPQQVAIEELAIPVAKIATEDDLTNLSPKTNLPQKIDTELTPESQDPENIKPENVEPEYPVAIEVSEQLEAIEEPLPPLPLPKKAILENKPTTDAEYEILFNLLHPSDLIATFPITTGKPQFIRRGYWKIKNSVELPFWRYDKSLLESGEYGEEYLNIPGGPNNPIGVMWHGLSRKGIGIHGTSTPETIGRSKSAGCIRLSNWNVVKLPLLVRPKCLVWLK